jgi:ribulose kinase
MMKISASSSGQLYLGLDFGTSGARAAVIDGMYMLAAASQ